MASVASVAQCPVTDVRQSDVNCLDGELLEQTRRSQNSITSRNLIGPERHLILRSSIVVAATAYNLQHPAPFGKAAPSHQPPRSVLLVCFASLQCPAFPLT